MCGIKTRYGSPITAQFPAECSIIAQYPLTAVHVKGGGQIACAVDPFCKKKEVETARNRSRRGPENPSKLNTLELNEIFSISKHSQNSCTVRQ